MVVSDAHKLGELESDNVKLKRLMVEQMFAIDGLTEFSRKK
jgi:putative transposase